ncbi:hypothetical protein AB0M43_36375 [Longispora sp. NPDC051575]|uniref:hypothetical protein n=1 Tax=Longispora sp. NPDC051575 TaxID=3154943 RepID=UPI0034356CB0
MSRKPRDPHDPVDPHRFTSGVEKLLFTLSGGFCYFPECRRPVVVRLPDDQGEYVDVDIAHIYAAEKGGPRYREDMTNDQRRAFTNLILLCKPHHKLVDGTPDDFTVVTLHSWKTAREGDLDSSMIGLSQLTEDKLEALLISSMHQVTDRVSDALDQLAMISTEAADLLRGVADRMFVDPDTAYMLYEAAGTLRYLEDNANTLHRATDNLGSFEDNVNVLYRAADNLGDFEQNTRTLDGAAERLETVSNWLPRLEAVSESLERAVDSATELDFARDAEPTVARIVAVRRYLDAEPQWVGDVGRVVSLLTWLDKAKMFGIGILVGGAVGALFVALMTKS